MTANHALKEFGDWIRSRRESLGIRRSEFASRLGWKNLNKGSRRVCTWENGNRLPPDRYHCLITEVFKVSSDEFQDRISRVHAAEEEESRHTNSSHRISFLCQQNVVDHQNLLMSSTQLIFETPAWRDITIHGAHTGLM